MIHSVGDGMDAKSDDEAWEDLDRFLEKEDQKRAEIDLKQNRRHIILLFGFIFFTMVLSAIFWYSQWPFYLFEFLMFGLIYIFLILGIFYFLYLIWKKSFKLSFFIFGLITFVIIDIIFGTIVRIFISLLTNQNFDSTVMIDLNIGYIVATLFWGILFLCSHVILYKKIPVSKGLIKSVLTAIIIWLIFSILLVVGYFSNFISGLIWDRFYNN